MPVLPGNDALPDGTHLGEYEIMRVLGMGGFGIVYLATDHALQRLVAIKEYMPSSLAGRSHGAQVSLRSSGNAETYMIGLRSFVNEARLLARFDHPALVKVYRFWEQNGTAYMVMPYYEGLTLKDVRARMGQPPTEAWLRRLLAPVLGALQALHAEQVYHRDVSPDNVLLLGPQGEGAPVLLDLGAARRVIADKTQSLTAILKPSYAPIEQYADVHNLKQGPWTDLYALASVVYFCIAGQPPSPATSRTVQDDLRPLKAVAQAVSAAFGEQYSPAFLDAIDWALAVRPADRPQSVAAFVHAMDQGRPRLADEKTAVMPRDGYEKTAVMPREAADATRKVQDDDGTRRIQALGEVERMRPAATAAGAPLAPVAELPAVPPPVPARPAGPAEAALPQRGAQRPAPQRPEAEARAPSAARPRYGLYVAAALALAALGTGIGWVMGERHPAAAPVQAEQTTPAAVPVSPAVMQTPAQTGAAAATAAASAPPAAGVPATSLAAGLPAMGAAAAVSSPVTAAAAQDEAPAPAAKPKPRREPLRHATPHEPRVPPPEPAPAVAAAPPPAPAVDAGPATPREACGRRVFIALFNCMKEQCERPRWVQHPQCVRLREMDAKRQGGDVN